MKILKYGFFGEDSAQFIFLQNYLNHFTTQCEKNIKFITDDEFCKKYKGKGRTNVEKLYKEMVQIGIEYWQQNVFFIGIDADTEYFNVMEKEFSTIKNTIFPKFQNQTCILLPIQAIEYWLWYLKLKIENPSTNKNEPLEKYPRTRAKEMVYGMVRPTNEHSDPIVRKLSSKIDIQWLESRSESFRHFHNQVIEFVKNS